MKRNEWRKNALVFAALGLLGACQAGPYPQPGPVVTQPEPSLGQTGYSSSIPQTYVLRPADVLSISVFREEGLTLPSVPISATGQVSFPLVGQVDAAGMTPPQLEAYLERALNARFLRDPDVTVNVIDYRSHEVTVEGGVTSPGLFTFSPGTRLSGGVALANGLSRVADREVVVIFRETPEGRAVAKFDYAAIQEGTMIDPVLQPGDRVVVGLDALSQFWQDVLQTLPAFAFFTRF